MGLHVGSMLPSALIVESSYEDEEVSEDSSRAVDSTMSIRNEDRVGAVVVLGLPDRAVRLLGVCCA